MVKLYSFRIRVDRPVGRIPLARMSLVRISDRTALPKQRTRQRTHQLRWRSTNGPLCYLSDQWHAGLGHPPGIGGSWSWAEVWRMLHKVHLDGGFLDPVHGGRGLTYGVASRPVVLRSVVLWWVPVSGRWVVQAWWSVGGRQVSGPLVGGVVVGSVQWSLGGLGSVVGNWPAGRLLLPTKAATLPWLQQVD
jgi:hypothetical protein